MNIYVASSWRCQWQPAVVEMLRADGHDTYDFREPEPGEYGFAWSEIDPEWESWTARAYVEALKDPVATRGFGFDMRALERCDACVLVLPSGRSAHLELGWAVGAGKHTAVYIVEEHTEPELMYLMCDAVVSSGRELLDTVRSWAPEGAAGS